MTRTLKMYVIQIPSLVKIMKPQGSRLINVVIDLSVIRIVLGACCQECEVLLDKGVRVVRFDVDWNEFLLQNC